MTRDTRPTTRPSRFDEKQIHFQPNYTCLSFTVLRQHAWISFLSPFFLLYFLSFYHSFVYLFRLFREFITKSSCKFIEGVQVMIRSVVLIGKNDTRWTICSFYKIRYHCLKNWKKIYVYFFFLSTRSFIRNKWIDPYWGMKRFEKHRERLSTALRHLFPIFSYNCKQLTKIRINNDGHVINRIFFFLNE